VIAPEDPTRYAHHDEGPDDMPSHLRSALTDVQVSIPMIGGRLMLGTWQAIYLFEHRRAPHRREWRSIYSATERPRQRPPKPTPASLL
jgi:secondary thiamine-phosphate synthase enzyme